MTNKQYDISVFPPIIDELNELFKDKLGAVFQRDISEIKMELKEKGLSTKPPKEFTNLFLRPHDVYLQACVCPKDKEQDALNSIEQWLGHDYNLNNLSPIEPRELFEHINRFHKIVSRKCELNPFLVGMRKLSEGLVSDKQASECPLVRENKLELLWNEYIDFIVSRASQTLEKIYPDVNKKCLIAWLTEIARIPIRKELSFIITQMIYERNHVNEQARIINIEQENILYMQLLLLNSQKEKVIYCIYRNSSDINSPQEQKFQEQNLQIYFSNGEGQNYHSFKYGVATQCAKILNKKEFTNQAFFIDLSKSKVSCPFLLFCILTEEQRLILIGIKKNKGDKNKKILAEALKISGIQISNYAIFLEQKLVSGKIEFEKPTFRTAKINLNGIKTNYIPALIDRAEIEGNFFFTEENTEYINAMIKAMEKNDTIGKVSKS